MTSFDLTREFYVIKEVAALLRVSNATILKRVNAGQIAATRFGPRKILISRAEVEKLLPPGWFKRKYREAFDEIAWFRKQRSRELYDSWKRGNRVKWREMTYEDFVAYFHLVIVRKWHDTRRPYAPHFPTVKWISRNGFKGFILAIMRHLKREQNVNTARKFINNEYRKRNILV